MIFKIIYQENPNQVPLRENAKTLFMEADSKVEVRQRLADNTPYNIQHIEEISGAYLEYEQSSPDYRLTEF